MRARMLGTCCMSCARLCVNQRFEPSWSFVYRRKETWRVGRKLFENSAAHYFDQRDCRKWTGRAIETASGRRAPADADGQAKSRGQAASRGRRGQPASALFHPAGTARGDCGGGAGPGANRRSVAAATVAISAIATAALAARSLGMDGAFGRIANSAPPGMRAAASGQAKASAVGNRSNGQSSPG
jgi:hypothetical protein